MNLPTVRRHNLLKTNDDSDEKLKSALSICQEAALLANNKSIQHHCQMDVIAIRETANLVEQIQAIEAQIERLPTSFANKLKEIRRLQSILNQLEKNLASEDFNVIVS